MKTPESSGTDEMPRHTLEKKGCRGFFMHRVRRQIQVPQRGFGCYKGVTVAVLDTGIERHPDLEGKLLDFRDFVGNRKSLYDDNGHGTHVCGIICGSGGLSRGRYAGMAPKSMLVVGKVLDSKGDGTVDAMLRGLSWVWEERERYGIRILNISVGLGTLDHPEREKLLQREIEKLWDKGVLVVCAAGNKGPGDNTISAIGDSSKVLTVGCHDGNFHKNNPKSCERYSGRGAALPPVRKPNLVAPGTDIFSCNGAYTEAGLHPYVAKSGTSMATPIVAGAAALALERCPAMTNEELKLKITASAVDLGEPWNKQGWGMVNVRRLLE